MTPDWAAKATAVPYASFGDPQTLNLYTIARNNPVTDVDLDGHLWTTGYEGQCGDGTSGCAGTQNAADNNAQKAAQAQSQAQTNWSFSWQVSASANFLVGEVKGVADVTVTPLVNAVEHPIDTVAGIVNAVAHPIDTATKVVNGAVDTAKAAASGDPRAIGQVVGTAATVAYAAENVKIRAYDNTGGGGINFKNTPTTGSSIRFDLHPLEKGGSYKPHVDITIKKPGVPSGPGSNLVRPIHHGPWE
jgi:hypothetical protein